MIYIYMKVKDLWIKFIVKDYNGQKKYYKMIFNLKDLNVL